MANKRMFTMLVVGTDAFLSMPPSTQNLYFHLNMRADDDGFVGAPRAVMKEVGANEDDLRILISKMFVLWFDESGVIVIRHWRLHNAISKFHYHETLYIEERNQLLLQSNGTYSREEGEPIEIGVKPTESPKSKAKKDVQKVLDEWNTLQEYGINAVSRLTENSKRYQMLCSRLMEYGVDDVLRAVDNIRTSDFLKGKNNRGWIITLDWFVRPNNFPKVLEGNYNQHEEFRQTSIDDWGNA